MSAPRTVAVIGLGLMGGSLARDLAASGIRVLGFDADPIALGLAHADGVVAGVLDASFVGVTDAELVVIAAPVDRTEAILALIAPHLRADAVVTDLGSTKTGVLASAERVGVASRFVGSHPMAGDHRSGWEASRAGLYREVTVFVCESPTTTPEASAAVRHLWESVGGECTPVDPRTHDELMAWVSHLPQVAASAVAAALATSGHPSTRLGRGGRDVTRLAASSPEMWSAICRTNAPALGTAVRELSVQLAGFEAALRAGDDAALRRFFQSGHDWLA